MEAYTDEQQAPPPKNHRGCLWGCLAATISAVVIVVVVFGYGAWHFYKEFSGDERIQTVIEAVKKSEEATSVLGKNVRVLERTLHTYDASTGRGTIVTYVLKVAGSRGEGEVKAEIDIKDDKATITSLVLTDSEGHIHYIVGTPPPNPMMQNSI